MLTREQIEQRFSKKGWCIVDTYTEVTGYRAVCAQGHKLSVPFKDTRSIVDCPYCRGMKATISMVQSHAKELGYTLLSYPKSVDKSGNEYIKKGAFITVQCSEGHTKDLTTGEFMRKNDLTCTICSPKVASTAYSRSEEIIARVLDYVGVNYIRQAVTDTLHGQLRLDFTLPDYKVIIEYDGLHHVYGRNSEPEQSLVERQERDRQRDSYAESIGFRMIRISHYNVGKRLVCKLAKELPQLGIDIQDPMYDTIIQEVFDYAHKHFKWDSYEKIKIYADIYKEYGRVKGHELTGRSGSNLQRDYATIYGNSKKIITRLG